MTFEEYCLVDHSARFTTPITDAQRLYMAQVALVIEDGGQLEVPSLPRGCGTSTILGAAACFAVMIHKEPFVLFAGSKRLWHILPAMAASLGLDSSSYFRCDRKCWIQLSHRSGGSSLLLVCDQATALRGLVEKINGFYQRPSLVIVDGQEPLTQRQRKHFRLLAAKAFISDPLNV